MIGRQIFWRSLKDSEAHAAFLDASVRDLLSILRAEPLSLDITGKPLCADSFTACVEQLKDGNIRGGVDAVRKEWSAMTGAHRIGLVVYCDPDAPLAHAARRLLPHAAWGINLSGAVSVVYASLNKYAVWHETLHLLGAQDHYDLTSFEQTCDSPGCVMQYAPDERCLGLGPTLCSRTIATLRKVCGNYG